MRNYLLVRVVITLAVLLAAVPALAASPFDGTWKTDTSTAKFSPKPHVYVVKDGMFACKTCVPAFNIKADGTDQAVSGDPYADTIAVKLIDDHTVSETEKKAGKTVYAETYTIAADGKSFSVDFTRTDNASAPPVTGKVEATRVGKAPPAGANALSGSWSFKTVDSISDSGITMTLKTDGDSLALTTPTGQSYTAKLDGTSAPFTGDPGVSTVSLKKMGASTIEETDLRDGKPVEIIKMTVTKDGKSMKIVESNKLHGTTSSMTALKQG